MFITRTCNIWSGLFAFVFDLVLRTKHINCDIAIWGSTLLPSTFILDIFFTYSRRVIITRAIRDKISKRRSLITVSLIIIQYHTIPINNIQKYHHYFISSLRFQTLIIKFKVKLKLFIKIQTPCLLTMQIINTIGIV